MCQEHRGVLCAVARKLLRGREADVDDFVQEAIGRYLQRFRVGPRPANPAAWLMKTLMNLLLSDWRKRCVRRRAQWDPNLELVAGPQPVGDPDREAPPESPSEEVTFEQLEAAVGELSPKLRTAYLLHAAGHSNFEIAERLAIGLTAVRKRLFDARRRLRILLVLVQGQPPAAAAASTARGFGPGPSGAGTGGDGRVRVTASQDPSSRAVRISSTVPNAPLRRTGTRATSLTNLAATAKERPVRARG